MTRHKKNKSSRQSGSFKHDLLKNIISVFEENPTKSFNYKQLSSAFGFKDMTNKKKKTNGNFKLFIFYSSSMVLGGFDVTS